MNIAYLMNTPIPSERANSVHVMKMCQSFQKSNNEVTLFCEGEAAENQSESAIFEQYNINTKFKIKKVYREGGIKRIIPHFLISAYKMSKLVKKTPEIDFVYGRSLFSIFFLRNSFEFMYESHISPINSVFKYFEKRLLKNSNCVKFVVISQALKNEYLRIFPWVNPDKILVLHDGADIKNSTNEKARIIKETMNNEHSPIIGYLGHLYPGKCMEVLMKLALKRPQYIFHVVGGTDEWVNYWKEQTENEKIFNVKFYGYIKNSEIAKYYNAFDIFLLPFSKNIYFNKKKSQNIGAWISPLKLFEAMAFEKTILSSKLPTLEEVLTHNINSLLVDPDDIDAWGENLDKLANDSQLRNRLSKNARVLFEEKYTWDKRVERIIFEYNKLVSAR